MHIFDSFAGLPESESAYYNKGDFYGEYDEVRRNVEIFGSPQAVTYHKGYFSDTVQPEGFPRLLSMWLDVDLQSSSRDAMLIADKVDALGAVFSHECTPDNFSENGIVANGGPESPVAPIVERFSEMKVPLAGRFVTGSTGAFWRKQGGIPVLSNAVLLRLVNAI